MFIIRKFVINIWHHIWNYFPNFLKNNSYFYRDKTIIESFEDIDLFKKLGVPTFIFTKNISFIRRCSNDLQDLNLIKNPIFNELHTNVLKYIKEDLEDIELPFRINDCEKRHRENVQQLRNQMIIIDKKQDHKGKELLSSNEEEKLKALREFYKKEEEALDLFLGEGGTRKLLNGRKPEVLVKIIFNQYGKVLESKIIKKSGFLPMDNSIEELLTTNSIPYDISDEVWDEEEKIYHNFYEI